MERRGRAEERRSQPRFSHDCQGIETWSRYLPRLSCMTWYKLPRYTVYTVHTWHPYRWMYVPHHLAVEPPPMRTPPVELNCFHSFRVYCTPVPRGSFPPSASHTYCRLPECDPVQVPMVPIGIARFAIKALLYLYCCSCTPVQSILIVLLPRYTRGVQEVDRVRCGWSEDQSV